MNSGANRIDLPARLQLQQIAVNVAPETRVVAALNVVIAPHHVGGREITIRPPRLTGMRHIPAGFSL